MIKNTLIVHGLIEVDHKYLIIKKNDENNDYSNYWDLPGGEVAEGTLPQNVCCRLFYEQLGIDITILKIIYEESYYNQNKDIVYTRLIYQCALLDEDLNFNLNIVTSFNYQWISSLDELLNENIVTYLYDIINKKVRW